MKAPKRILLVEDDMPYAKTVTEHLEHISLEVTHTNNAQEAYRLAGSEFFAVVILDWYMGDSDGSVFLVIKERQPDAYVIVHSGNPNIKSECIIKGANSFVAKNEGLDKLTSEIKIGFDKVEQGINSDITGRPVPIVPVAGGIVTESQKMLDIIERINKFASYDPFPVLIYGETGTGKELVAQILHEKTRKNANFVPVNCAAIPGDLIESELFGHCKGAFTNAYQDKVGLFEYADHGTLFLDEIGSMPLLMQSKLLRVLQDRQIRRVGETRTRPEIDVRVIAASNVPLKELVTSSHFRSDLYYRISVLNINIPPLRERQEDISVLAKFFLQKHSKMQHQIDDSAMNKLTTYSYPGNVRELESIIQRAICLADGELIKEHHIEYDPLSFGSNSISRLYELSHKDAVGEFEKLYFSDLIERNSGNMTECARQAGISRSHLYKKLGQLGINI